MLSQLVIDMLSICHSCCVWSRVLWQAVRQRSDGDQLDATDLGQLVGGVTFILFFKGRHHSMWPRG